MIRVIDETGPAEAATSPGRGSNNPAKENAVNSPMHTTAFGGSARAPLDYEAAYWELEDPIISAVSRVNVLCVVTDHLSELEAQDGFYRVSAEKVDAILYMVMAVHRKVVEVDGLIQATCRREISIGTDNVAHGREMKATRDRDLDALGELIVQHRQATIAWNAALQDAAANSRSPGQPTVAERTTKAAWDEASRALLSWRPRTLEGNAARIKYLTDDEHGLWRDTQPGEGELWTLFTSMMEAA